MVGRSVVLAALVVLPMLAAGEARAGDPSRVWKTIETEHFVIHYYEPLDDVGRRVAAVAERSHRVLVPAFGHTPAGKTQIVIVDDTDGANGFANVLPRNAITLFATAPTGGSVLADHDDWLYGLTAHEYTHVVHLDTMSGLPVWVNRVLGKTWAPNQIQPRWVIEGIATYEESKRSSAGRTRNALFDMNLRVATLADEEFRLDEVTNSPRAWPRGTTAYLYGSHFLEYIFDRYGDDKLRELSWAYGSNPIPYGLNRSIEIATGRRFVDLYEEWREHLRDEYAMQREAVERRGVREGRRLTFTAEVNLGPEFTPDGKQVIWRHSDGFDTTRFYAVPTGANFNQAREYLTLDRVGGFDVLPDGSMIVEQTAVYRSNYDFQDLWRWDARTREMTRLTHGLRARDPAASPDFQRVAFVINGESRHRLAVMPLRPEAEPTILWEGDRFDQASMPAWSPDGKRLAFSAWRTGGYRDILLLDLETREVIEVMRDRAMDLHPVFDPRGRYLYFSSDRTGIYNLFAYDLTSGELWQVTNVIGGADEPAVSPDGARIVYQGFGVGGWDLYEIALEPETWLPAAPYVNDRPDPVDIPDDEAQVTAPRSYRPLETLAPQRYELQLVTNTFGNALNVTTGGSDIVGFHSYNLGATVGLDRGDISFGGAYSYNRLWPSLRIGAARNAARRAGVFIDAVNTNFVEETYSFTASAGLPVLRDDEAAATVSVSYDFDWLRNAEDEYGTPDPNDAVPRFPETDVVLSGLSLRIGYGDTRGGAFTLGPSSGQEVSGSVRINHPAIGSDFHSLELTYNWRGYRRLPWGDTPTISLRLAGGIRTTDRGRTGVYGLGGVPEQNIVDSILQSVRAGSTGYLRGYSQRTVTGAAFHLANLEYRQELLEVERGIATLPFYVRKLHFAGLMDVGNAYDGPFEPEDLRLSVGASLRLDMVFGYFVPGALDIGYARGLTNGGIGETWMLLTGTL